MTTTLTATPQPSTASVLLEITADVTSAPTVVLDLDAAEIKAEEASWSGTFTAVTVYAPEVRFYSDSSAGTASRTLTGLTVGKAYRVDVWAARSYASRFEVVGKGSVAIPAGSGTWVHSLTFTATATTHILTLHTVMNDLPGLTRLVLVQVPDDYALALVRSDANGVRPVRLYDGQDVVGGSLVVTDYEAALTGLVSYTATTTGAPATASVTLGLAESWLTVPVTPQHSERLDLVTGYTGRSDTTTTVHRVIGREDPVLTLGRLRLRAGALEVWCPDHPTALAVRAVYGRGEVVMLRQADHPGLDMYHAATGRVSIEPHSEATNPRRWRVSVDYTEVAAPTAPLAGALGWTFAESTVRHATFAASSVEFATFTDLLIGPPA